MWDDERSAGVALRALYDDPAPSPVTTVAEVISKGRHRVRAQRLSVLALVVTLVAVAGGGLIWFRSLTDPPVDDPLLANAMPWPEDLPGWSLMPATTCEAPERAPAATLGPILPQEVLEPAFVDGVYAASGTQPIVWMSHWSDPGRADLAVEVPVDNATASVYLEVSATAAPVPVDAANFELWSFGPTCAAPMRRVLASGAVMQLYAPDTRSPFAPVQRLRTYLPGGRVYMVTSAGWGRADVNAGVVTTGRGKLPLDGRQLAEVATRLVDTS